MKVLSLVVMSLSLATSAAAQAAAEPPQIIVTGEGVVKATPDQAWVQIGAESRSKVSKEAQQRNAEVMTAVQQKISSFGIPKDALKTVAVDLQPEFDYANGKQTLRGYVARNTIEVRVDDLTKLGDVVDAAVASGAATIHGLRFGESARRSRASRAAGCRKECSGEGASGRDRCATRSRSDSDDRRVVGRSPSADDETVFDGGARRRRLDTCRAR